MHSVARPLLIRHHALTHTVNRHPAKELLGGLVRARWAHGWSRDRGGLGARAAGDEIVILIGNPAPKRRRFGAGRWTAATRRTLGSLPLSFLKPNFFGLRGLTSGSKLQQHRGS